MIGAGLEPNEILVRQRTAFVGVHLQPVRKALEHELARDGSWEATGGAHDAETSGTATQNDDAIRWSDTSPIDSTVDTASIRPVSQLFAPSHFAVLQYVSFVTCAFARTFTCQIHMHMHLHLHLHLHSVAIWAQSVVDNCFPQRLEPRWNLILVKRENEPQRLHMGDEVVYAVRRIPGQMAL